MIDSVFGVGVIPPNDEGEEEKACVFVSDRETWEEEKCCSDSYLDDTYKELADLGLYEEEDGIWAGDVLEELDTIGIGTLMTNAGFTYDSDFEEFMRQRFEEG